MIRLVVFDCDGTLVDSQHMIVAAMRAAYQAADRTSPDADAIRRIVGLSLEEAIGRLSPDEDAAARALLATQYKAAFLDLRRRPDQSESLFPGAREALERLSETGYRLGVATGKSRRGLIATLERYDLAHHFDTLQTADDAPSKPHPEMMRRAMAEVGVEQAETVLVGDTTFDMQMARNAGVLAYGVGWGNHEPDELVAAGAESVVVSFDALVTSIEGLSGRGACTSRPA